MKLKRFTHKTCIVYNETPANNPVPIYPEPNNGSYIIELEIPNTNPGKQNTSPGHQMQVRDTKYKSRTQNSSPRPWN